MDIRKYVENVDRILALLKTFAAETQTIRHDISQAVNDHESVLAQVRTRKEEVISLDNQLATRANAFERNIERMNLETNQKLLEADRLRKQAAIDAEMARQDRQIAAELKEDAQRNHKEPVMAGRGRTVTK